MSDSSLSDDPPPDATLEQALRHFVQLLYQSGNLEDLTIRRIRKSVEENLNLQENFFKTDAKWKEKSKMVIESEVDAHAEPEVESSRLTPKAVDQPPVRPQKQSPKPRGIKRMSTEKAGRKKRRKSDNSEDEVAASEAKPLNQKPEKSLEAKSDTVLSNISPSPEIENEALPIEEHHSDQNGATGERSESEMSELIDEVPKPKRSRKPGSSEPKAKKTKASRGKKTVEEPKDPNAEEIKRLQGWLVKCGIRKMWFRELAPYNTPKTKIIHLKEMLADAGMSGRYSEARAEQIREERELKADIEAVQEGDKLWGQSTTEEDPSTSRPKRRLAKGLEGLDFLNDDDGEETD